MIKEKRSLSGIWFRSPLPDGRFENRVFEDLTEELQDHHLKDRSIQWYISMIKRLASIINELSDTFDITAEEGGENK